MIIEFDYQSNRHCAKTTDMRSLNMKEFDYQSNRHCAKTQEQRDGPHFRLITSQIDTAPKHVLGGLGERLCLITSQIDTAPKLSKRVS